jgi:hypothetical protein
LGGDKVKTPRTDDEVEYDPTNIDDVKNFARKLEVQLNVALGEIGELRRIIVELTAAGNCVEGDKNNLAMAIRNNGGFANVKRSTDNWIKAKDWDRRKNGTI